MSKRSDLMTKGPERAPHRSLLRADGLTDWELPLLWPFSRQGFVFPLVPWGDAGATLIFAGGMFAMVRWPQRLQTVAVTTLLLVVIYVVVRGVLAGRL